MLTLSVRQPWAWMIIHGGKNIENRTWSTKVRGPVLIHASGSCKRYEYEDAVFFARCARMGEEEPLWGNFPGFKDLQLGGIVGQVDLIDCTQKSLSPWFTGPYGFVLANPKPLPWRPLRGSLGFFEEPDSSAMSASALQPGLFQEVTRDAK
ncbi:MAG: ASCH domain-containing protein [Burkholderiaceae bacterium]|nr:MAG: ASCH domain-containing protein [Burkholderiaceae bacterium]TBR76841.1 MAG: ASCH domain-containing protein [Burkholderiaceae bacterium]